MPFDPSSAPRLPSPTSRWVAALERTARIGQDPHRILARVIDDLADEQPDAPALIGKRDALTFRALAERSRRYARWAISLGIGHGDVVCLAAPNRPDYVAIWLGLSRVGATVALVNTNLAGASLAHCLGIVAPGHVVAAAELIEAVAAAASGLSARPRIWSLGSHPAFPGLDDAIEQFDGDPFGADEGRAAILSDRALCIYTSGTTSLPKAANVSHHRLMMWSHWFAGLMDTGPADRLYNCLPMYHSIGGVVATGSALVGGGAVVIRERFSASRFWDDVVGQGCTLFQYIGELCRYLLHAPPHPLEREHRLRLCAGNGLRADVWTPFQERFRIPQILEFYAATENTVSLYNVEGKVGAVGRVPPFLAHRSPAALVRLDDHGEPLRGDDGLCVRAGIGEVGELLGRLAAGPERGSRSFEGYTSEAESRRKLLRDVFQPGDCWLRSGDLMSLDAKGFFYFADRLGDTFRWKGENVATTEVEAVLARVPGVIEAAVYGVEVAAAEGRAGMAALRLAPAFDLQALRDHLALNLPRYARPVFLRVVRDFDRTETFKIKKRPLAEQGFDPAVVPDALFVDDAARGAYVPLDAAAFERIRRGVVSV